MSNTFRYKLYSHISTFIVNRKFISPEEMGYILDVCRITLCLPTKRKESKAPNLKDLRFIKSRILFNELKEHDAIFLAGRQELVDTINKIDYLLELNTYTSVYFAFKHWRDFWSKYRRLSSYALEGLMIIDRPEIRRIASNIFRAKSAIFIY